MKEFILISPELGDLIRKTRKEKKKRQEDLADDIISPSTISNIERGACQVSKNKFEHLCKKLDLDLEKEQPLLKGTTAPDENLSNRLMAIENDIDLVSPDLALEELREIHLEKNDPLLSEYFFLKAKCYSKKSLLKKAHSYYLKSIQQADITKNETNLRAAAYYEIGRIMHSNSIKEALHYVEKGLGRVW